MLLRRAVAARLLCSGLASCIGPGCPSVLVPFCCCALLPVSSRPLSTAAGVLRSYASRREREGGAGSRRPHPLPTGALVDVYALNGQLSAAATGDELLALVEARAAAMNDVNAATALTRLAKLPGSWKDDPRTQKLCILAGDKVAEMGARTLANTLWAVAKLALPRPPWLKQWLAASLIQLRYMNPQELSNTLYALGEFGAQHGDGEWTTAFWSASSRQLGAFQPQALSNTLAACVKLNLRPSVAWRARYLDASLRTLSAYTTQNLSNSILALSDLDARPGRAWMTAWAARAAAALPLFNEQEACNSLLALVQLGAYDSVALSPLWARVQQLLGPRSRTEHLHIVYGVHLAASAEAPGLLAPPRGAVLAAARGAWRGAHDAAQEPSANHRAVRASLASLGLATESEHRCAVSERHIDIVLLGGGGGGGGRVAIEVDGPQHFHQDRTPTGSTLFRDRQLDAAGWTVLSLPWFNWPPGAADQQRYLRARLAEAGVGRAGGAG